MLEIERRCMQVFVHFTHACGIINRKTNEVLNCLEYLASY